jgi:inner membrane protein
MALPVTISYATGGLEFRGKPRLPPAACTRLGSVHPPPTDTKTSATPIVDNITHALAGLLLAEATYALRQSRAATSPPPSTFRRAAAVVGMISAELPDADLLYAGPMLGMGKLGYLLHHRGHTHTVLFALIGALVVWGAALLWRRELRAPGERYWLLALCLAGTASHLALDYTNNYGVHPFWPVWNGWLYGDAVFIIEPWLWVAAVPPLWLAVRGRIARVLLAIPLLGILAAAWAIGRVGSDVALALTLGTLVWAVLLVLVPPVRRVALGLAAWSAVELVFLLGSRLARHEVRAAMGVATLVDVVLTPGVGNPLCFGAMALERDGPVYRITTAGVASLPGVLGVDACSSPGAGSDDAMRASKRVSTHAVRWEREWSAPLAELSLLARTNCEIAAALRFVRVPIWSHERGDSIRFADLRYERGGNGFAVLLTPAHPTECPSNVPPWEMPRRDLLISP